MKLAMLKVLSGLRNGINETPLPSPPPDIINGS